LSIWARDPARFSAADRLNEIGEMSSTLNYLNDGLRKNTAYTNRINNGDIGDAEPSERICWEFSFGWAGAEKLEIERDETELGSLLQLHVTA